MADNQNVEPWSGSSELLVKPEPQIQQQDVQATAITSNLIGSETLQYAGPSQITVDLDDGEQVVIQNVVSMDKENRIVCSTEWAIFIDIGNGDHVLPGGSAVPLAGSGGGIPEYDGGGGSGPGSGTWSLYGPITSAIVAVTDPLTKPPVVAGELTDGKMQVEYVVVINNTGSTHSVTAYNQARYISNIGSPGGSAT